MLAARSVWTRRRPVPQRGPAALGTDASAPSADASHRESAAPAADHPHFHVLTADGLLVRRPAGDVGFHRVPAPSPSDLRSVVETVHRRVLRRLAKMGLLRDDRLVAEGSNEAPDPGALEACGTLALRGAELESHDGATAEPSAPAQPTAS